jgi:hypothetical protein
MVQIRYYISKDKSSIINLYTVQTITYTSYSNSCATMLVVRELSMRGELP